MFSLTSQSKLFSPMFYIFIFFLVTYCNICEAITPEVSRILQETLENTQTENKVTGATVAVILPGHGLWVGASGLFDRDTKKIMKSDNLFCVGSITKTFVATTVLQLVQEGRLTLDDSVEKWLPGLVPNGENINVRQLLNHTSGIYNYTDSILSEALKDPDRFWKPEEIVTWAVAHKPNFEPGEKGQYCNTGYIILGMIIEKVTGAKLAEEIRNRILEPLQLKNTSMGGYEDTKGEMANGYTFTLPKDIFMSHFDKLATTMWAAGGMISNAEDIAHWSKHLYTGSLLNKNLLDEMLNSRWLEGTGNYGLGVMIYNSSLGAGYGHTGGVPGFISYMFYFPSNDVGIAVLVNDDTFNLGPWNIFTAMLNRTPELLKIPVAQITTNVNSKGKIAITWGDLKILLRP
jgi:D-alanyl-D-alanine carboxypeptidase